MRGNVLSWQAAIRRGYRPNLYGYAAHTVPVGEVQAVLDFKIWAKKVMAINCYFTQTGTGLPFQLTVYCQQGKYGVQDLDFAVCPVNRLYRLWTVVDRKERVKLIAAKIICALP